MTQSGFRKVWKILLFFMGHWCVMKLFKMEIIYPGHFLLLILFLSIFGKVFPCFFYVFVRVPCLTSFYFKTKEEIEKFICFQMLKFRHSEKAAKIWNNLPLDYHLLSKHQIKWEIVSNFVAFSKNLIFRNSIPSTLCNK